MLVRYLTFDDENWTEFVKKCQTLKEKSLYLHVRVGGFVAGGNVRGKSGQHRAPRFLTGSRS